MPRVFLSPSSQEFNPYVTGGNEEYYMNLVADAIEPYLIASGVEFGRGTEDMSVSQKIQASNSGGYELHVAIHSNASGPAFAGQLTGTDIYYSPGSYYSRAFAEIVQRHFREIYYNPVEVELIPTTTLREVRDTNAPAVLIEVAYHDNVTDEAWIRNNINNIGRAIAMSITEYFGVPFVSPMI